VRLAVMIAMAAVLRPAAAQNHVGQYEQVDIEYGARIYAEHCITCHGERGDSMPPAKLGSGQFRHASTDRDLTAIIHDGIPGTAMAPGAYSDSELTALVAYLRNMTSVDVGSSAIGNADRGHELFVGKGKCDSCHRVGSFGPRFAPDLTNVGAIRTAATLQRVLVDPGDALLPINRPVRAVTRGGEVIVGRRLNEDTFTVQLVDKNERLRSLEKSRLREYSVATEATMPSYADKLTDAERADLVAYLLSLRGSDQ
jgi:putative heme-binding domain-containing protein